MTEKTKKNTPNNNLLNKLIEKKGCFGLQFRRDVRYERQNHPAYYRWKAQFIIVSNKNDEKNIKKIKNILNCGKIYSTENNIRYIVQKIDNLYNIVLPFLEKQDLSEKKKKELNIWIKAVKIIYQYKGKNLTKWKKKDFQNLLKLSQLIEKKRNKSLRKRKWMLMAESIAKTL